MNQELLARIDRAIEERRAALAEDVIRLVNIRSVKGEAQPGAPFGPGPRKLLDTVLEMGQQKGYHTVDHGVGVVSLAMKPGQPDLGIWLHGDVVHEGTDWKYAPYQACEYKGCIIGRGATDNKGQLCAIYHLLNIFRELDVPLRYNTALYVGSDEESGKHDLCGVPGNPDARGFCNVCTPPRLSLVPDASFPVGYGGSGAVFLTLRGKPLQGLTLTTAQTSDRSRAVAVLAGRVVEVCDPRCNGTALPVDNMTVTLMERLLEEEQVAAEDRPVLTFFRNIARDVRGEWLGLNADPGPMKPLTVRAVQITNEEDCPVLRVVIRYPLAVTLEEITQKVREKAEAVGLVLTEVDKRQDAYLLDRDWPVVQKLTEIANDFIGEKKEPYIVGGGTYAHKLPNALAFGMDGCLPPEGFPAGRGGAHGPDELVSLDRLQRAMKIYARALLALDEMTW